MTNAQVAATFRLLADLLAIRGESPYKVLAYRRAAESIAGLAEPLDAMRRRGALEDIPSIGAEIAQKIASLLDTGTFPLLQEVKAEIAPGVAALLAVPGIGPKRARALYQRLGIDSLDALRAALAQGRLGAAVHPCHPDAILVCASRASGPCASCRVRYHLVSLS